MRIRQCDSEWERSLLHKSMDLSMILVERRSLFTCKLICHHIRILWEKRAKLEMRIWLESLQSSTRTRIIQIDAHFLDAYVRLQKMWIHIIIIMNCENIKFACFCHRKRMTCTHHAIRLSHDAHCCAIKCRISSAGMFK